MEEFVENLTKELEKIENDIKVKLNDNIKLEDYELEYIIKLMKEAKKYNKEKNKRV